jgi:hypothetical protein
MEKISKAALIEARDSLGLGSCASMKDIKAVFRELAKGCHPDRAPDDPGAEEQMKRIGQAYRILLAYCEQYPIPLDEQSLVAHSPEGIFEDHVDRFYGDWFKE